MTIKLALIIEDDYDASFIFARALGVNGYETQVINRGDEALQTLREVVPDVVMLDLHLPNITGKEILEYIRAEERLKNTIVIIVSADSRMADVLQEDADLVLLKPTTFSQIRDFTARLDVIRANRLKKSESEEENKAKEGVTESDKPDAKPAEVKKKPETSETKSSTAPARKSKASKPTKPETETSQKQASDAQSKKEKSSK